MGFQLQRSVSLSTVATSGTGNAITKSNGPDSAVAHWSAGRFSLERRGSRIIEHRVFNFSLNVVRSAFAFIRNASGCELVFIFREMN